MGRGCKPRGPFGPRGLARRSQSPGRRRGFSPGGGPRGYSCVARTGPGPGVYARLVGPYLYTALPLPILSQYFILAPLACLGSVICGCCILVCWKLVRDGVAKEVSGSPSVVVRRVSGEELERLLRAKIVEEAVEFAVSGEISELVDLLEAIDAWLRVSGVEWDVVDGLREEKKRLRGGFEGGYVVFWLDRSEC